MESGNDHENRLRELVEKKLRKAYPRIKAITPLLQLLSEETLDDNQYVLSFSQLKRFFGTDKSYRGDIGIYTLDRLSKYLGFPKGYSSFISAFIQKEVKPAAINIRSERFKEKSLKDIYLNLYTPVTSFKDKVGELIQPLYSTFTTHTKQFFDFTTDELNSDTIEFGFVILDVTNDGFNTEVHAKIHAIIRQFELQNLKIFTFFLITNCQFDSQDEIDELQQLLDTRLRDEGIIEFGYIFDIEEFLLHYDREFEIEFRDRILDSNKKFQQEYRKILEKNVYLSTVPYQAGFSEKKHYNLLSYLAEKLNSEIDKFSAFLKTAYHFEKKGGLKLRESKWTIIISEFGFGKTTLLQNLFLEFERENKISLIFLPIAQFPKHAFNSQANFIRTIVEIMLRREVNLENLHDCMVLRCLSKMLEQRQDILLLLDGLDEHHFAYDSKRLKNIFNSIKSLETECILTVRKEFWDDKSGNLKSVFGESEKYSEAYMLVEWTNKEIIKYLGLLVSQGTFTPTEKEKLSEFSKLVKNDKYEVYYGDIPRRPLFLEMIVRDILNDTIKAKSITELYENYIWAKFARDRQGVFEANITGRPLRMEFDEDEYSTVRMLYKLLEEIAFQMLTANSEGEAILDSYIASPLIQGRIDKLSSYSRRYFSVTEIVLNSVLVPFNRRELTKEFYVKFSHRSFQEFYTAKYLINSLQGAISPHTQKYFDLKYTEGIYKFFFDFFNREIQGRNFDKERVKLLLGVNYKIPNGLHSKILEKISEIS